MLCELSIKNFAIIDDLRIEFSPGMTILSGETGAGKSIIINAVNLLLGSRASAALIRSGCDSAELEACFDLPSDNPVCRRLSEMAIAPEEGLIIRRVISQNNRHKTYINGRTVTLQTLQAFAENLASISGQHAHQGLLKEDIHLALLDEFGGLLPLRHKVTLAYNKLQPLIEEQQRLAQARKRKTEQMELLTFQKNEIAAADLKVNEDADLEREKLRLKNGSLLYQAAYDSLGGLYDAQGSVFERLTDVVKTLEKLHDADPGLAKITDSISSAVYQVEDVTGELRRYLRQIDTDPRQLEIVEERLDVVNRMKRKYGGSVEAVLEKRALIEAELAGIESISGRIEENEAQLKGVYQDLVCHAADLSKNRQKAAVALAGKVQTELAELMMPHTRFSVTLAPKPAGKKDHPAMVHDGCLLSATGMDTAVFMIAPNVGENEKPLSEIASGGELSRVVLALKAILAGTAAVETLVFDEVDAGIGGEAAEMVGKKLALLAKSHQVICITHLPQIATYGEHHFKIVKTVVSGRTRTLIHAVFDHDRVAEIARMLGGATITPTALDHAREMLAKK